MPREYPEHPLVGVAAAVWRDAHVLLIQRLNPPRAGAWSLPGGLLGVGETLAEGAAREVREETGCEITVGPVVATIDSITHADDGRVQYHYVLVDLVATWRSGAGTAGDDAHRVAWATLDELASYNLWSETERVIREAWRVLDEGDGERR